MSDLKIIYRKDVPALLEDEGIWKHEFLSVSRHRLIAHYNNPNCSDDDPVLILAYYNNEIAGYMGVFTDFIKLEGKLQKIGWLSTWWVHPRTKGSGIGREILNTMYQAMEGRIGISQFTPSAKRVYDKSGYFYTLKETKGVKAVLRSNLVFVLPALYPKTAKFNWFWKASDAFLNFFIDIKLSLQKTSITKRLQNVTLEYLTRPDPECMKLVEKFGADHISPKSADFFQWIKAYQWVQEAPLLDLTNKDKYEFSMFDTAFNIYQVKVMQGGNCIAFVVFQRRANVGKLLFAYCDKTLHSQIVADILQLQAIEQGIREIICYDNAVEERFRKSGIFIYKTDKVKESIISKVFGTDDFKDVYMNFGDGDCSFA